MSTTAATPTCALAVGDEVLWVRRLSTRCGATSAVGVPAHVVAIDDTQVRIRVDDTAPARECLVAADELLRIHR